MRVLVIGGGFAGVAAALRVREGGHDVTLIDAHAALGARPHAILDEPSGELLPTGRRMQLGRHRSARSFLARIGAEGALQVLDHRALGALDHGVGRWIAASGLPPAFAMLAAVAPLSALSLRERLLLLRAVAAIRSPSRLAPPADERETADAWLARLSQPASARAAFFRPIAIAALGDELATASARMLEAALCEALVRDVADAPLGVAIVDPGATFAAAATRALAAAGVAVRLGVRAREIVTRAVEGSIVASGVALAGGEVIAAEAVIAAIPPHATLELVPEAQRGARPFDGLARISRAPVLSIHLFLDRPVVVAPLVSAGSAPITWVIPSTHFTAGPRAAPNQGSPSASQFNGKSARISLIAMAARALHERDDGALVEVARAALARALPAASNARIERARVLREPAGAIAHPAGGDGDRPRVVTSIDGLYLAGDHARTGLPAGLESAVRSGEEAAAMALAFEPPPPPRGFVPIGNLVRKRS